MKRKLSAMLAALMAVSLLVTAAYASSGYQSGDVPIGSSNEVLMVGTVVPSVMSVTIPSYVPFHISRAIEGDNKVISPRITVTNNSSVPVSLDVSYTSVDLNKLQGATWGIGPNVAPNEIAIGFQLEMLANQMPTTLSQTTWLQANVQQDVSVMSLNPYGSSSMYVVGTLGDSVPENNSFSVIPTFVVRQA
ncbi:MAG: hypothetical protein HFE97_10620 [Oscillospiraceae bacterium]|nr:hypothetical protein [Oscillospiraceae bacterium]